MHVLLPDGPRGRRDGRLPTAIPGYVPIPPGVRQCPGWMERPATARAVPRVRRWECIRCPNSMIRLRFGHSYGYAYVSHDDGVSGNDPDLWRGVVPAPDLSPPARSQSSQTDLRRAAVAFAGCIDCGRPLDRPRHVRCSTCWASQPGQSAEVRRQRGNAISVARSAQERWTRDNPDGVADREDFRRRILPGLKEVTLSQIMAATGCAKATASSYRTGKTTPHPMYWKPLLSIVDQAVNCH